MICYALKRVGGDVFDAIRNNNEARLKDLHFKLTYKIWGYENAMNYIQAFCIYRYYDRYAQGRDTRNMAMPAFIASAEKEIVFYSIGTGDNRGAMGLGEFAAKKKRAMKALR